MISIYYNNYNSLDENYIQLVLNSNFRTRVGGFK